MEDMSEEELVRATMSLLGRRRTEKKRQSSAQNIAAVNEARKAGGLTEEHKAKLREAQKARRERERADRGEAALDATPKRGRGRPRKADTGEKGA